MHNETEGYFHHYNPPRNEAECMLISRSLRLNLLLLVCLMLAAPAAFASDVLTGAAVKYPLASPAQAHEKNQDQDLELVNQDAKSQEVSSQPPAPSKTTTSNKVKIIALFMLMLGASASVMSNRLAPFLMGIISSIIMMNVPAFFSAAFDAVAINSPVDDSGSSFPYLLVLIVPVLIFFAYRAFMSNRIDSEIDEVLVEALRAARTQLQSNTTPPSMNELRERQQQVTENEPVVVSSSASEPTVQEQELIEVLPGKRKIILD